MTILPIEHPEWNTRFASILFGTRGSAKDRSCHKDAAIHRSAGTRPCKGSGSGETPKERAMATTQGMLVELHDLERIEVSTSSKAAAQ